MTYTDTCPTCGRTFTSRHQKHVARALTIHSCEKWLAKKASVERRIARDAAIDKTPKPCQHKRANHQHGTHACYVLDRCRCTPCTTANTTYERQRGRLHAYGRFTHLVDAQPVRDHIEQLAAQGLGLKTIATHAGVSPSSLGKLVYGNPVKGHRKSKRVKADTATKVLAVRAGIDTLADGATLDGTGTRRRLQALIAVGWSQSKLAHAIGYSVRNFCTLLHGDRDVTAKTARTVRGLYDQLWDQQPPRDAVADKGAYTRSLRYAAERSWAPPLAWDDETIDDPAARPAHTLKVAGPKPLDESAIVRRAGGDTRVNVTNEERREVVRRLHSQGLNDNEIERLTGISSRQVLRDRQRLNLPANADSGRTTTDSAQPGQNHRKDTAA